ncbi:MAG: glutaredoxin family protein [Solirubrobacterales bacterium]|nr:glutaredoxin family protein [Solirubrobacterales bacterium]
MSTVTLYGRPGCCLCDQARARLLLMRAERPFELVEVDITSDDALHRRFLVRIPVVALDGQEIYDYEVDEADLAGRLDEASSGRVCGLE